jgi:putative phosphoribosyl transferase
MSREELPRAEWARFLNAFGRQYETAQARIEGEDEYRPLKGVRVLDNGAIEIAFGGSGGDVLVRNPRTIAVRRANGLASALEIEDESGKVTALRLKSAVTPAMLDGIAPGELRRVEEVKIKVDSGHVGGTLTVPADAQGIVIFAHGSGSGRFSPRNQLVASRLQQSGFATLLMDLLTEFEEAIDNATAELRFDIPFLGWRLAAVTDWVRQRPEIGALSAGYFGASTGAAAALVAAADRDDIGAIVSRGGRPDLAGSALRRVRAPTLLLVGENDPEVIRLNRLAAAQIPAKHKLEIVPGATHLFEEPGALELVAERASEWFREWLTGGQRQRAA